MGGGDLWQKRQLPWTVLRASFSVLSGSLGRLVLSQGDHKTLRGQTVVPSVVLHCT